MSGLSGFDSFLGNPRATAILKRAVKMGRLPHAWIFAGPDGVGKKSLAVLLARRLNCLEPRGEDPCARCPSCRKIDAGSHPDLLVVEPDKTYIKIEQVRAVIREVAYRPFEGKCRVVIFDGAERMRQEAANSLLKTLEEPSSTTVLVLVTTQPYALLLTIRSRAQLLQFNAVSPDRIAEYMVGRLGRKEEEARLAAAFSNGSLTAALEFDVGSFRAIRSNALRFVSLLLHERSFAEASSMAGAIAKDKDGFIAWLGAVDGLLREIYYSRVAEWRTSQPDIAREVATLSARVSQAQIVSAIRGFGSLRRSMNYNLNRQIALESLFVTLGRAEESDRRR